MLTKLDEFGGLVDTVSMEQSRFHFLTMYCFIACIYHFFLSPFHILFSIVLLQYLSFIVEIFINNITTSNTSGDADESEYDQ